MMNNIKYKLNKLFRNITKGIYQLSEICILKIISLKYKNKEGYKNIWLISERGTEAKDNGYHLFKYLRENHPEINVHYIIDSSYSKDYEKVKKLGNIIEYKSIKHKILFILSDKYISTHIGFISPWNYKLFKKILDKKNYKKYIFLQHGIIKDDLSSYLNKNNTLVDLFITSTQDEKNHIINNKNYGFNEEVVLTGLARFDNLYNFNLKNQILLMPTWRSNIVSPSYKKKNSSFDKVFVESDFFEKFNSLLNNKRLIEILKNNNIDLIFYPHYEIQQYIDKFTIPNNSNIKIAKNTEYDVQVLLKESKMLITDFSSVFFDFAYMEKPLIYYQFDRENFKKNHYKEGYFNYNQHGFGKVIEKEQDLVSEIEKIINNNYIIEDIFKERIKNTFTIKDCNNCKRIYNEIVKL